MGWSAPLAHAEEDGDGAHVRDGGGVHEGGDFEGGEVHVWKEGDEVGEVAAVGEEVICLVLEGEGERVEGEEGLVGCG